MMAENLKKYNAAFKEVFGVDDAFLNTLVYKQSDEWNSMGQIALVSALEVAFGIDFDMEDIFALTSYEVGKELLRTKFDIEI